MTCRHAVGGLLLSWLWSFLWNTPPLFGWGSYEMEGVRISCAPKWQSADGGDVSYIIMYFVFCFAVPFSIITVSYWRLLWTLRQVGGRSLARSPRPSWGTRPGVDHPSVRSSAACPR